MFRLPTHEDLEYVLAAAMRIDDAVAGCIQIVDSEAGVLAPLVHRGLTDDYVERFGRIRGSLGTPCSQAWTERRRIVIRDVLTDIAFEPYRADAVAAGYRSVQSTPLVDSEFHSIGVLSTYFPHPHHPGSASLATLDRYCRVASLVMEAVTLHEAIVDADKRLSIPARALPGPIADSAGAAKRLLEALSRPNHSAALDGIATNLESVVRHLRSMIHQAHSFSILSRPPAFS